MSLLETLHIQCLIFDEENKQDQHQCGKTFGNAFNLYTVSRFVLPFRLNVFCCVIIGIFIYVYVLLLLLLTTTIIKTLGKGQVCPEGINNHTFVLGFFVRVHIKDNLGFNKGGSHLRAFLSSPRETEGGGEVNLMQLSRPSS